MQELFFELLRVAVGQMDCLSRGPSVEEWNGIYQIAQRHGLVGVCYKGVERLFDFGLRAPQDLSIDWMADAEMIREEQELYENRCEKLVKKLHPVKCYMNFLIEIRDEGLHGRESIGEGIEITTLLTV